MQIYLDNAATTSVSEAALQAMLPYFSQEYGNPSSLHSFGQRANEALTEAREKIAALLHCQAREITFTSGGSEADNQAIRSAAQIGARNGKRHIISTAFEHHAVLHTLAKLEKEGFEITLLDVHEDGLVRPQEVEAAIRPDTCLVTVMYANNEIGTIQPVEEIGQICREKGVLFHTDAVQAAGHLAIDVQKQNIDLLSGGEKGLAAIALLFSILKVTPAPFCFFDEVEAALDDVNVTRYAQYARRMTKNTQFILITHRRGTMEEADVLYGVTMQEDGVSKLLELKTAEMAKKLGLTQ